MDAQREKPVKKPQAHFPSQIRILEERAFLFVSLFPRRSMSAKIQTDQEIDKDVEVLPNGSLPGFRKGVYISSIVAALGGFLCGYDTGAVSGILTMGPFQDRFFTPDDMEYLEGLILAFFLMTAALGAFFSGFFCGM